MTVLSERAQALDTMLRERLGNPDAVMALAIWHGTGLAAAQERAVALEDFAELVIELRNAGWQLKTRTRRDPANAPGLEVLEIEPLAAPDHTTPQEDPR